MNLHADGSLDAATPARAGARSPAGTPGGSPVPGVRLTADERLRLVLETERMVAEHGDDLQAVLQLVADRMPAIVDGSGASVSLVEGDELVTRATSGDAAMAPRRPISESISRFAIETAAPVLIVDARTDPRINQATRAMVGNESVICVPFVRGDEVIGILHVFSNDRARPLDENDSETLELLSVVVSAAIGRAAEDEARREAARALTRFRDLFDGASLGILRLDGGTEILEANPAVEQMLGESGQQLTGRRFSDYLVGDHRALVETRLSEMLADRRQRFELEVRCQRRTGELRWCYLRAVVDHSESVAHVTAMVEDVTARKRAQSALTRQLEVNEHQALHDPLTGLPNRRLFTERIGQAIRMAKRRGARMAVLVMDLDRFKEVNDLLGHPAGDELLVTVGERIQGVIRESDTVARLGGDEFGLLLPELDSAEGVRPVLERIRLALERPISVNTLPLSIEASIGVAVYPEHGTETQLLLQRADVAMYQAKRESSTACFYERGSEECDVNRLTLVGELRRAMTDGELELYYQPQATLADGRVGSAEALVRWHHPTRGLIMPDGFVPIVQETGLIGPLTLHILALALRQVRVWSESGLELGVAVNLSTRNLLDRELPGRVSELLTRWQVRPGALALEVTESSMMANPKRAKQVLGELAALGVRLSIDDFGTGYSSLSYLRELPVDEVKIDRSFVMRMGENGPDAAIVRSTIDLGRNLGLDVVAEGVEDVKVWETLRELGCRKAQGYHLSRPVPAEVLTAWLRARVAERAAIRAQQPTLDKQRTLVSG
jgi:diguanylate cyclase (GGDEF)-like protein/PAS domain S-box-containing protein